MPKRYRPKTLQDAYTMSGLTQDQIANLAHLSDSTVNRVLTEKSASSRAINAVADALHVSRDEVWK